MNGDVNATLPSPIHEIGCQSGQLRVQFVLGGGQVGMCSVQESGVSVSIPLQSDDLIFER